MRLDQSIHECLRVAGEFIHAVWAAYPVGEGSRCGRCRGSAPPSTASCARAAKRKIRCAEWSNLLDEGKGWVVSQDPFDLAGRVGVWRRIGTPIETPKPLAPRWLWAKSLLLAEEAS